MIVFFALRPKSQPVKSAVLFMMRFRVPQLRNASYEMYNCARCPLDIDTRGFLAVITAAKGLAVPPVPPRAVPTAL